MEYIKNNATGVAKENVANATSENVNAAENAASTGLTVRKLIFTSYTTKKEQSFTSLEDLFRKEDDARGVRSGLFGHWLTEVKGDEKVDPDKLIVKVNTKIEQFKHYINNLLLLRSIAQAESKTQKTMEMVDKVKDMNAAELSALVEAIKLRQAN